MAPDQELASVSGEHELPFVHKDARKFASQHFDARLQRLTRSPVQNRLIENLIDSELLLIITSFEVQNGGRFVALEEEEIRKKLLYELRRASIFGIKLFGGILPLAERLASWPGRSNSTRRSLLVDASYIDYEFYHFAEGRDSMSPEELREYRNELLEKITPTPTQALK